MCSLVFAASLFQAASDVLMRRDEPVEPAAGRRHWAVGKAGGFVAPHDHRLASEQTEHERRSHIFSLQKAAHESHASHTGCLNDPDHDVCTRMEESESREVSHTVDCQAGWTCVGGGCVAREDGDQVQEEKEMGGHGWTCSSMDTQSPPVLCTAGGMGCPVDTTKKVWAICARSCSSTPPEASLCEGAGATGKVFFANRMCSSFECSEADCCHFPPTCSTFADTCGQHNAGLKVPKPSHTPCAGADCLESDCCRHPQSCAAWSGSCHHAGDCVAHRRHYGVKIPAFDTHVCQGAECSTEECCEEAPTCSSFTDPLCTGMKLAGDITCCNGSCTCAECFAGQ